MKNNIKDIITIAKSPEVEANDIYPNDKKTIMKTIKPNIPTPGVPESFRVLVKELQALALDIKVLDANGEEIMLSSLGEDEIDQRTFVSPIEEEDRREVDQEDFEENEDLEEDGDDEIDDDYIDNFFNMMAQNAKNNDNKKNDIATEDDIDC